MTYKDKATLSQEDLQGLADHANNMVVLLKSDQDEVRSRRHEIRQEVKDVVMFLYEFNINLTHLLTRI